MAGLGQTLPSSLGAARPLPPSADIGPGGQSVGQAAHQRAAGLFLDQVEDGSPRRLLRLLQPREDTISEALGFMRREGTYNGERNIVGAVVLEIEQRAIAVLCQPLL